MRVPANAIALACASTLIAACAPDAYIRSKPYDAFLAHLAATCRGESIGPFTVDQLVRRGNSQHGNYFIDKTSLLYFNRITAKYWTTGVTAFLHGWPQDPGIDCVLREYNETREWATPEEGASTER